MLVLCMASFALSFVHDLRDAHISLELPEAQSNWNKASYLQDQEVEFNQLKEEESDFIEEPLPLHDDV